MTLNKSRVVSSGFRSKFVVGGGERGKDMVSRQKSDYPENAEINKLAYAVVFVKEFIYG